MPRRATKRGDERTPLEGECDVLVCGASFAGLTIARELAGSGARVLVLDRYEIGERQTSACAAPTEWLEAMGVRDSIRQTFDTLVVHTPHTKVDFRLPWTFSTFDYRELCGLLWEQMRRDVRDREGRAASGERRAATDDADHRRNGPRPDQRAARRRRPGLETSPRRQRATSRPTHRSRGAWRCIRTARATRSRSGSTAATSRPAMAGASPPATRSGSGSARSIPAFTSRSRPFASRPTSTASAVRYQGNWIPHKLRPATADGVFFVGDSAGHCLPLTAEGIRTAFYFGIACGRELRRVVEGRASAATALRRYGAFSARHEWQFKWMLRTQKLVPRVPPRMLALALRGMERGSFVDWSFGHYLRIAHPSFAQAPALPAASDAGVPVAA